MHPSRIARPTANSGLWPPQSYLDITYRLGLTQARAAHANVRSGEKVRIHDAIDISPMHEQVVRRGLEPCHEH